MIIEMVEGQIDISRNIVDDAEIAIVDDLLTKEGRRIG